MAPVFDLRQPPDVYCYPSVMIAPNLACDVTKSTGLTKSVKRALELTTAIFHGIQAGLMVALSLRLVCCSWVPS